MIWVPVNPSPAVETKVEYVEKTVDLAFPLSEMMLYDAVKNQNGLYNYRSSDHTECDLLNQRAQSTLGMLSSTISSLGATTTTSENRPGAGVMNLMNLKSQEVIYLSSISSL